MDFDMQIITNLVKKGMETSAYIYALDFGIDEKIVDEIIEK